MAESTTMATSQSLAAIIMDAFRSGYVQGQGDALGAGNLVHLRTVEYADYLTERITGVLDARGES